MATAQQAVQSVLDQYVHDGRELGLQAVAWFNGEQVVDAWAGLADRASGRAMDGESLTTVFSVTKGIASIAVHLLTERGQITYDTAMAEYVPEFGVNGKEFATVAQAMSHQAGIPQVPDSVTPETVGDLDATIEAVLTQSPMWEPGTAVGYHSLTHGWMTAGLVRAVDGRPIDAFIREEMLAPLGLERDVYLGLPASADGRVAPLVMSDALANEPAPSPESYRSLVNPSAWWPLGRSFAREDVQRAVVPGAGGIATARGLAKLYAATIDTIDGVRLLPSERVRAMSALQTRGWDMVLEAADPKAIGFFLGQADSAMSARESAFGHPGYGGAIAFADPDYGFAFALTKNQLAGDGSSNVALDAARAARRALDIPEV